MIKKKYLVFPGEFPSKNDDDRDARGLNLSEFIHLMPRYSGDYADYLSKMKNARK